MRITYELNGINDFHDAGPISLVVSGEKAAGQSGEVFRISRSQARRIEKHFCGVSDCHCAKGAVDQLDAQGTEWGISVHRCEAQD